MPTHRVDGAELYYEAHGTGEPVLFIHGFPLSGRLWTPCLEALKDRWKLIVPDVRGFGRSTGEAELSMARMADDVPEILEAPGERRPAVIVGMSMGGYIAFEVFRRHPACMRALVLVDTHPKPDSPQKAQERAALAERTLSEGVGVVADAMLPNLFGPQAPDALKREWRQIMLDTRPRTVAAALRAMAARADSGPTLPAIRVPVHILVGEHDAITPPDTARAMHAAIPGAGLQIIPDSGHMLPVEQPQAFAASLRAFLELLPPAAS